MGGKARSVGSVGQIKVEDVYGVKSGSVFRKLIGKFSWERRGENKNAERERRGTLPCLAVFIENWTILNSCSVLSCPDFPAHPFPVIPTQEVVLVFVQGSSGAGGYFKKHQQGQAHQYCQTWTLRGWTWLIKKKKKTWQIKINMFGLSISKEQWWKTSSFYVVWVFLGGGWCGFFFVCFLFGLVFFSRVFFFHNCHWRSYCVAGDTSILYNLNERSIFLFF